MKLITDKQADLIDDMNELCQEKLFFNKSKTTCKEASEYISRNIEEFREESKRRNFETLSSWQLKYM